MKYVDIHCHLDFPDYEKDYSDVFERMKEGNVSAITIGTDLESSKRAVQIAEENENVWACVGMHPIQKVEEVATFNEEEFEKMMESSKVVGIGECGLDFFRIEPGCFEQAKEMQEEIFVRQIEFALRHDRPLMLHCRDSYDDVLDILEAYKKEEGERLRGNSHFFAGDIEQAKRFLDMGFTCSFTGVITFTQDYDEVIKFLPMDSIMSETDAPFVSPVPYRGKRNEPSYIVEVVKRMAQIKGIGEEAMAEALVHNAKRLFGLVV